MSSCWVCSSSPCLVWQRCFFDSFYGEASFRIVSADGVYLVYWVRGLLPEVHIATHRTLSSAKAWVGQRWYRYAKGGVCRG